MYDPMVVIVSGIILMMFSFISGMMFTKNPSYEEMLRRIIEQRTFSKFHDISKAEIQRQIDLVVKNIVNKKEPTPPTTDSSVRSPHRDPFGRMPE